MVLLQKLSEIPEMVSLTELVRFLFVQKGNPICLKYSVALNNDDNNNDHDDDEPLSFVLGTDRKFYSNIADFTPINTVEEMEAKIFASKDHRI